MDGGSARDLRTQHERRVHAQLTGVCATAHSPDARTRPPSGSIQYISPEQRIRAGVSPVRRVSRHATNLPLQTGVAGHHESQGGHAISTISIAGSGCMSIVR
jgi:hypothetical protein